MLSKGKVLIVAVASALVGAFLGYWGVTSANQSAIATYAAYELSVHEKTAVAAFAELEPKANVLVQKSLVEYATRQHEVGWITTADYHRAAGYAHARAAQALVELGDQPAADSELSEAVKHLAEIGTSVQKEELLSAIRKGRNTPVSKP